MADNCPYNCKKGKVFMEGLRKMVECPHCTDIERVLEEKPNGEGPSLYDKLNIPPSYRNYGVVGTELLNPSTLGGFSRDSINDVGNMMENINRDLYNGEVTSISCYFHTTNLVDMKRFVYGAQKLALEKGLGVTPFISANALYGLQKVGDYSVRSLQEAANPKGQLKDVPPDLLLAVDGYRLVQETGLTYHDYTRSDLCFIDATANTTERGWTGIADLLGERAKYGLPTHVIGYWSSRGGSWTGSKGLKYLLANENGMIRLELLVPFELKSKRGQNDDASVQRTFNISSTKSPVTSGLSIDTFMSE
jgi:hypothetical protein